MGPAAYEQPAIGDAAVAALAARVRVFADPAIAKDAMEPVRITVTLHDGRSIALRGDTLKGSGAEPMTETELQDKLRGCFAFGLDAPAAAADHVAATVFGLENEVDAAAALCAAFPSG